MSCRVATRSGFTLLEMLLALAIMAVLSTALYASLHTGFDARSRAEASVAPTRAVAVALEMIGRDIASALPPTGILAGAFTGSDATGATASGLNGTGGDRVQDADSLQFYAVIFDADRVPADAVRGRQRHRVGAARDGQSACPGCPGAR
jgi:prepilin-type N-terminal cleavage/methylation domain-containing protein